VKLRKYGEGFLAILREVAGASEQSGDLPV
jgi:hypothetical protein